GTGTYARGARKLYVGNLHYNMKEDELRRVFKSFGPAELVEFRTYETGDRKGFGFIHFVQLEDAGVAKSFNEQVEIAVRKSEILECFRSDFVDLHLNDIEEMLLLTVQHKLYHLDCSDIVDFIVVLRTLLDPFQFSTPTRRLTMEEMVNKFIEEGRQEHEEIDAFIRKFKTTNELLLKERNNSLCELRFEVYGLTRAFKKAHVVNCEIKGVTTRGGKTTIETTLETNIIDKPSTLDLYKPVTPIEAPPEPEPKKTMEQDDRPKVSTIPFPHQLKKEKEEAQQRKFLENLKQIQLNIPFTEALAQMPKYAKFLKSLLSNKTRLEEACIVTMNERPFLATAQAMIDVFNKKMTLKVGDEEVIFDVDQSMN
ncbi:retrovirus-related pol polyprotein from transposon TNT 1-94, partial [Tanacetum coccineum]